MWRQDVFSRISRCEQRSNPQFGALIAINSFLVRKGLKNLLSPIWPKTNTPYRTKKIDCQRTPLVYTVLRDPKRSTHIHIYGEQGRWWRRNYCCRRIIEIPVRNNRGRSRRVGFLAYFTIINLPSSRRLVSYTERWIQRHYLRTCHLFTFYPMDGLLVDVSEGRRKFRLLPEIRNIMKRKLQAYVCLFLF